MHCDIYFQDISAHFVLLNSHAFRLFWFLAVIRTGMASTEIHRSSTHHWQAYTAYMFVVVFVVCSDGFNDREHESFDVWDAWNKTDEETWIVSVECTFSLHSLSLFFTVTHLKPCCEISQDFPQILFFPSKKSYFN